jgi:hypothetical protein
MKKSFPIDAVFTGAITPGSSYIKNIKIEYPYGSGIFVSEVPAGEKFGILLDYKCVNEAGTLVDPWSMCIVWWDDEKDILGYYWRNLALALDPTIIDDTLARVDNGSDHDLYDTSNNEGGQIMPNHKVKLHFNMFANNDNTPATLYPDIADWALVR